MAVRTPESIIIGAIHGALTSYPEGDGGPHLDYRISPSTVRTSPRLSLRNWLRTALRS